MTPTDHKKRIILVALLLLGGMASAIEFYLGYIGAPTSARTMTVWLLSFGILSIYWIIIDARQRQLPGPYTKGFIMYVAWPVMVPAYFIKRHGPAGILWSLGFFFCIALPEAFWLIMDSF